MLQGNRTQFMPCQNGDRVLYLSTESVHIIGGTDQVQRGQGGSMAMRLNQREETEKRKERAETKVKRQSKTTTSQQLETELPPKIRNRKSEQHPQKNKQKTGSTKRKK